MNIYLSLVYFFCAFLNIILGIAVYLFNRKSKTNISFFIFTLSIGFWIISLFVLYSSINPYNAYISNFAVKLAFGFSLLMSSSFTAFIYYFPKQTIKFSKKTKIIFLTITILIFILTLFTSQIHKEQIIINGVYHSDKLGALYIIYLLFLIFNFIFAITIGVNKLIKLRGIDKKKEIIVLAGIGTFGFFAILVNVVLPIFDIYIFEKKTVIFSLFFLIPAFYSFQKHRFFNISYLSLEFLRKFILISLFLLATVVINHTLILLIPSLNQVIVFIISTAAGLFVWIQLQKYFPNFIPADFAKFKKNILKLRTTIPLCNALSELENILEKYFIIKLNISNAKLYITRNTPVDSNLVIYIKDEFTNELKKHKNDVLVKSELEYMKIDKNSKKILLNKMTELDAELCMPLFAEHKLIGFFILGNKEKNKLYTKEEINQILKIKSPMEIAITNFLIKLNLQEENNLMKEIIEDKTKKLKNQFNEIKMLLEQQSDFIAVTAHEFRTPLSIAMFQLEDTLTAHRHTPQVVKDMEVMSESLNNLKNLTQKLFDVQQYDLNKIKLNKETINLNDFLNKIYQEFKIIIEEKNIDFKFKNKIDKNKEIEIDKYQIRQVLTNLLNNAIKFADKNNPQITIELKEKNNSVQIAVIDNGEGVSDKDKKRVFEKFQTTKASKGTGIGLGLYLCKKIIELHKGEIWIDNNEDSGTKFIFELRK